ncbi:MAG: efflux RND transporter permease subunit [Spirochaetaceae bacterium]|jgi:HAE1 family hydrophobic/amphiphilic exporter-1|nr:efflux RND transporter permease subunit [Spirochaetaceae bacterium]
MNIINYSVHRPVTIIVLYALAMGIAATLVPNIAVDLYPSTARPVLSVNANLPGAGPADIERNLTIPLERALASSRNLTKITSNSSFENSSISLNFAYGTDMDKAAADAQAAVNRIVNSLPDGVSSPVVRRFDISATPIMRLIVRGNYPSDRLRLFAEDEIQSNIERIAGVASADVTGGMTQIVSVDVSLNRLAALNISLSEINAALKGQNILQSGGSLLRGKREYQIMIEQELKDLDEIKRLVVKTVSIENPKNSASESRWQLTRVEDIADVYLAYNDNAARVSVDGESAVYIQVQSESGSNTVQVARRVRSSLAEINAALPRGITLDVLSDNTSIISATLDQVYSNALQGALLCMLIIFIFLRNIKGTLIIGISIPISILLTLMFMSIFGFTLNLLTMTGLILALGMTVDASIVIIDNVHNYRLRGAKASVAAILGSSEMAKAIITSTTTTLCVFIPLLIYKNDLEMAGQLFNDLIFTVIISLSCSLFVALTIVPALCGPLLKLDTRKQKPLHNPVLRRLDDMLDRSFNKLAGLYSSSLEYCLHHRLIVILLTTVILVFSFTQFTGIGMNMFIRTRTDDNVNINVAMPQGTPIEITESLLFDIEDIIKDAVHGYKNIILTARRSGNNQGTIQIILPEPSRQIDTPDDIIKKLTPIFENIPDARISFRAGRSISAASPIEIALSSRNITSLMESAAEVKSIIQRYMPEIENPEINISEGAPQLQVEIDRDRAQALGVSLSSIANEIRTAVGGTNATSISQGERLINIQVRLREEDRRGLAKLDSISLSSRNGGVRVPLSNIAKIAEGRAPSSIRRENQQRIVNVTGELNGNIAATETQARLKETIAEHLVRRDDVTLKYLGEAADVEQFNQKIVFIVAVAIFLVFGLMASQFESFVDPLIIFFSIPLLFIGVIWIYKIGNQAMSMFSAVGIVALVGVVVNNGIVLVDYTNTLRARGLSVNAACLEAGKNRLRPILMTTLSTVLAMAPIAFFPGTGADTIQPIGKTFVGGLSVSSVMTLFITPVLYSLFNSKRDKGDHRVKGLS